MKYIYICVIFLFLFQKVYCQFPNPLVKCVNTISSGFSILIDQSERLTFKEVLAQENKFQLINQRNFVPRPGTYWIHIKMTNRIGDDKEWIADFQNWSYVNAYVLKSIGGIDSSHKTGHLCPYQERDYQVANKAYLRFALKADSTIEYFLRLQLNSKSDMVPESFAFNVSARSVIDAENSKTGKIIYVFLAIFFIMFIYNLFIYISVKLASYAYYLILLTVMFYATAVNSGYVIELFYELKDLPIWLLYFEQFSASVLGLSILLFGSNFLQVAKRYPSWQKVIQFIVVLFIITGIIGIFNTVLGIACTAVPMLITTICIVTLAIKSIKDKYSSAGYFLTGYLVFLLSTIFILLGYLHIIPANIWTMSYSIAIGSTVEILMFSFALADLINVLRLENYESQKKEQAFRQEQVNMRIIFQQELLKTRLEIQEQTFHNISQEIHDNVGQILSLIKVNIDQLISDTYANSKKTLVETKSLVSKVIHDIRNISKSLNTDLISKIGLLAATEQQLNLLKKLGQHEVQFLIQGDVITLSSQTELVLFRIIQELLTNILKHSGATKLSVILNYQPEELLIIVNDNGCGFDVRDAEAANKSLGLLNIRNRSKMIGGSVRFDSQKGSGTTVLIHLPHSVNMSTLQSEVD